MADGKGSDKEIFLTEAESYLNQGQYVKAQDLAQVWLDKFAGDAEARVILCHAWTRMGKLDKVKRMLQEVDEAILSMSLIYARMGDICSCSGLNQEAIAFYRRFLDLNPDAPLAIEIGAKLKSLMPSPEEENPLPPEEKGALNRPVPGMQTVTMAELYARQGHGDLAVEILNSILAKDRGNTRAAAFLNKLQGGTGEAEARKAPLRKPDKVISELTRWLTRVDRIRDHAA